MFEITTRPPNSYVFHNQQQQQQQQGHRRNPIVQYRSPRSSSLSTPVTNFSSHSFNKHFPHFFLHNDVNNLTQVSNNNNDIVYMRSGSPCTNIQPERYVTRIITTNQSDNNNKGKKLASSSASYFHPNDHLFSSSNDLSCLRKTPPSTALSNGTILPVYYQSEHTNVQNTLPTLRNIPVSKPAVSNTKQYSSVNMLPNLIGNNVGSATSIVTVTNNNNGVKTYQQKPQLNSVHSSYTNLNDSLAKSTHIPLYSAKTYSTTNDSDYPLKLTTKQYSVIKGIKARQEMLSNNFYNKTNDSNETTTSNANNKSTNLNTTTTTETFIRQDTPSSFASSSGSLTNLSTSNQSNSNQSVTQTKSILVNKKRFANPANNFNKKTVSFAT